MRKSSIVFFIIILVLLLTACEPASRSEVIQYAKREYGLADFIDKEVVSEDEIIYYLRDKEYGFEYYVKSEVVDISLDGSKFAEAEQKESDFGLRYFNYIIQQLTSKFEELEDTYNVEITEGSSSYGNVSYNLAEIYYKDSNTQTAQSLSKKVNDLFKEYDHRDYWTDGKIDVYDLNNERIGCYDLEYNMWMTPEHENDYYYIEQAKVLNSDAVYVRKEQKLFKDTGLSLDDVYVVLGEEPIEENTMVTYYYFTVDGKEFFFTDVKVNWDKSWYTNYYNIIKK